MKLFTKIFLSLLVLISISFSIYSLIVIDIERTDTNNDLLEKIAHNKQVYSSSISYLIYQFDKEVLESLLTSIYQDKEVVKIELVDTASVLNFTFDKKFNEKEEFIESKINLVHNKLRLGTLTITYTKKYINKHLLSYEDSIFNFSLILGSFLLIVIYFFINRFTNSLSVLMGASKQMEEGNFSEEINIKTKDEIGTLAKKFESMRMALKSRIEANEEQALLISNLNKNLEKEVSARTQELERTNEELEDANEELQTTIYNLKQTQDKLMESEKMASLGSLVAGVAHEINTPVGIGLTGITYFIDESSKLRVDYKNDKMSEERFQKFMDDSNEISLLIKKNLERTAHLVKSFKQVAVDQTNDEQRQINLKNYVDEVLFSLHNMIKKTNINIDVLCDADLKVKIYPGALSQIVTNLVINSIRHGFDEKEAGNIVIDIAKKSDKIEINYKDNGKGIKAENLNKIFDPFFTTNRKKGGTGLGLNIIYNIITSTLNGSIECKSEESHGVEFIITLPFEA